jgi:hypothetical protein
MLPFRLFSLFVLSHGDSRKSDPSNLLVVKVRLKTEKGGAGADTNSSYYVHSLSSF